MIKRTPEATKAILSWWHKMHPDKQSGERGDRAGIARLRHAVSVMEASMEPAVIGLCRDLDAGPSDLSQVALIAAVLADLRETSSGESIAKALGYPEDTPPCSALRFRRMLEARDLDVQLTAFRRALALLKHKGNLADLVDSLLDWNDPYRRDARRQRWLYDYYQTNNSEKSSSIAVEAQP
jgi:CRISPR type I-E-associated protein CasB/Cse2